MTPAQRLAHALYGYHDDTAVKAARDYAKRLKESGFAIVPVEATGTMVKTGVDHRLSTSIGMANRWPADTSILFETMIEAYQQEIET